MTGKLWGLFARHSILARTLEADAAPTRPRSCAASTAGGLLHRAFGGRALGLLDRLSPAESASYLSGLLIGEELS